MEADNNQGVLEKAGSGCYSNLHSDTDIQNNVDLDCLELGECTTELVPAHLLQVLQFYSPAKISASEIIFLLSYISAIENGYITCEDYAEKRDDLIIPAYGVNYYHSKNIMKLTTKPPTYSVDKYRTFFQMKLTLLTNVPPNIDLSATLTATVTGDWLILSIHPSAKNSNLPGYSTVLVIGRYVVNVFDERKPIQKRFRRIDELSKKIADEVLLPMRTLLNSIIEKHPDASLNGLPTDVHYHINKFLSVQDADRLSVAIKRTDFDNSN